MDEMIWTFAFNSTRYNVKGSDKQLEYGIKPATINPLGEIKGPMSVGGSSVYGLSY